MVFCGVSFKVKGPKGGERDLRLEVSAGELVARLDGSVAFLVDWAEAETMLSRLLADVEALDAGNPIGRAHSARMKVEGPAFDVVPPVKGSKVPADRKAP